MFQKTKIITVPAAEPVTLTEARAHLRIDDTTEDTLITTLITLAREYVEARSGRAIITQTWEQYLDEFPAVDYVELKYPKLQSITSVKYYDVDNVEQTWTSTNYDVDIISEPGYFKIVSTGTSGWPTTYDRPNAVTIRYVCGYGAASTNVPEIVRAAIKLLISHFFENREAINVGAAIIGQIPIPDSIDHIINMFSVREVF